MGGCVLHHTTYRPEIASLKARRVMQISDEREVSITRLRQFCDNGFKGSTDAAALVLGRDGTDLEAMLSGDVEVDDDLKMKMNAIAEERGITVEGD